MAKKPINITVLPAVRATAELLAGECGDGSISALFERLVEEEHSRVTPSGEYDAFKNAQVWTAMLTAFPAAVDAFRALASSQEVRDEFRLADLRASNPINLRGKLSPKSGINLHRVGDVLAPPIQAALAARKRHLRGPRSELRPAPQSAPSVRATT